MNLRSLTVALALIAVCQFAAAQSVTLVTCGEELYQIQLPPDPDPLEQQAADELETYLAKLSGRSSLTKAAETPV
ncbi:MAG: hypothetical protein ACOX9R_17795, partial [Armatimonadota bacterium]